MEWLAIPLSLLAMAFMFNGFPSIHFGSKHEHYHDNTKTKNDQKTN
jgi:hypothetical protein